MPFGLTNAPSTFQAHVNRCFNDLLDKFVLIYLDDFLIYSDTEEEHVQHVSQVLQRIIDSNLACNLKKCKFHQTSVEFLGYQIDTTGVSVLPNCVKVMNDWVAPKDLTETQRFLGFCNFYRGFVPRYSELATPLTELTRKDVTFHWGTKEQAAFDALKLAFTNSDIVRHYKAGLQVILETDASDFALSGVLSQVFPDGCHPIGFLSRKLRAAELNYDTHDKELLAIIESLKGWRHWTMETSLPVKVLTDHNNLKYFMTSKELNRRQVRWAQFLSDYNFELVHRPGKDNVIADALSRRSQDALDMGDRAAQKQCLLPPERFVKLITENNVIIKKEQFVKIVNSCDYVHEKLIDSFYSEYATDEFYNEVAEWYTMDPSETTLLPAKAGKLKHFDEEPDSQSEG